MNIIEAKKNYTNRYTMEHCPDWAKNPLPNGKYYAPQYKTDKEWFDNTDFPPNSISRKDCYSHNESWPLGKWLDSPFQKNKPDFGQSGPALYIETFHTGEGNSPAYAEISLIPGLVERIHAMAKLCENNNLIECTIEAEIKWSDDYTQAIDNAHMVVTKDSFWAEAWTTVGDGHIETRSVDISQMDKIIKSGAKEGFVSASDTDELVKTVQTIQHMSLNQTDSPSL